MGKTWVLDTETKGTGANMVPLEKTQEKPDAPRRHASRPAKGTPRKRAPIAEKPVQKTATPLPPGHVRKKTTGDIGKVRSVDPKAGTAEVFWLRSGYASTVPLSAISRR
jgi:hypothetical protein